MAGDVVQRGEVERLDTKRKLLRERKEVVDIV